ncbi:MAG TPA: dTMP kinase [Thermoanaerobaculia bacterium]|jgi:dTMP kinase|nr:dTMP kinase [Thermoanaerobaculia bacterium]
MPPLFITFEGIDGSGKSTHLRRAAEWLARHGVACRRTHEPGGTPLGDALRLLFLDPRWGAIDGTVELLMLFASRRQHLLEVIEPALAAGEVVLCDRFTDSTRAYQGSGRGVPLALIDQVDLLATGGRRPDRTLLFDLPAAAARARRHAGGRGGRRSVAGVPGSLGDPGGPGLLGSAGVPGGPGGRQLAPAGGPGAADRLDAEGLDFYERVRQGFVEQARREPLRFRIIESGGDPARTATQVREALADLLPAGVVNA